MSPDIEDVITMTLLKCNPLPPELNQLSKENVGKSPEAEILEGFSIISCIGGEQLIIGGKYEGRGICAAPNIIGKI